MNISVNILQNILHIFKSIIEIHFYESVINKKRILFVWGKLSKIPYLHYNRRSNSDINKKMPSIKKNKK